MINNVTLVGRLTKDIDLRKTVSNISTTTFTLACDKKFKAKEGEPTADFISCVAWRQSADFLSQYAHKGDIVGVEGSIQTRNYEGEHGKVYVTEVLCDRVRLLGGAKPKESGGLENKVQEFAKDNDIPYTSGSVEIAPDDLPFY